jgi:predicted metal-dependent hydrolase
MNPSSAERSQVRFGNKTIGYEVQRSARRSTVSIAIDPKASVLVTAPPSASIARLDTIVHAKASWIVQRLKRQSDLPPASAQHEFVSGETFLYLGRQHRLRLDLDDEPRPLRLELGWLRVPIPRHLGHEHRGGFVRAALIDWYTKRAAPRLSRCIEAWAGRLELNEPPMLLAEPSRRWGSASSAGVIRINWRIIQAPLSLVDYVLVHELTHLRHPNHTKEFWAALGRVMPDYEERKTRLRRLGPQLDW